MCVIAVCEEERVSPIQVEQMYNANNAGAGVAWRESGKVLWKKGLNLEEIQEIIADLPLPFVAHFRIPSCGGSSKMLTHPFPISKDAELVLEGSTTGRVLFHNGHWRDWKEMALKAGLAGKGKIPAGIWSDSRVMAWMANGMGLGVLTFIDEKVIAFGPYDLEAYGSGWSTIEGGKIWVSNTSWERPLYTGGIRKGGHTSYTTPPASMLPPSGGNEDSENDTKMLANGQKVSGGGPAAKHFPVSLSKVASGESHEEAIEQSAARNGQGKEKETQASVGEKLIGWVRTLNPSPFKGGGIQ